MFKHMGFAHPLRTPYTSLTYRKDIFILNRYSVFFGLYVAPGFSEIKDFP